MTQLLISKIFPQLKTMPNFVFFGTSAFSMEVLRNLEGDGVIPSLIVTTPDMPKGRKLTLTPPEVKVWAIEKNIPVIQPKTLKDQSIVTQLKEVTVSSPIFVVASYGKIIPKNILDIPKDGCINIHPSLLPKYRGPSPIQSQIVQNEEHIGTSIMLMDAEVDHGSILGQKEIKFEKIDNELTEGYSEIEKQLAKESSNLFLQVLPVYLQDKNSPKVQEHDKATFTKMIEKSDGELSLESDPRENYRKYLAYMNWPGTFFWNNGKRVLIKKATFKGGLFVIERVLPEGRKEISYEEYLRGI